jgi:hypothetical protein
VTSRRRHRHYGPWAIAFTGIVVSLALAGMVGSAVGGAAGTLLATVLFYSGLIIAVGLARDPRRRVHARRVHRR